jgi:hypothetical protein
MASGDWLIYQYDTGGAKVLADYGTLCSVRITYTLKMAIEQSTLALYISNVRVHAPSALSATYTLTNRLGLLVFGSAPNDGIARFRTFVLVVEKTTS